MKDIECINCKRKYKLKISDDSFRVNKVFIFDEKADKHNNRTWNVFRCSCGVVIEDNYVETNTTHNSSYENPQSKIASSKSTKADFS